MMTAMNRTHNLYLYSIYFGIKLSGSRLTLWCDRSHTSHNLFQVCTNAIRQNSIAVDQRQSVDIHLDRTDRQDVPTLSGRCRRRQADGVPLRTRRVRLEQHFCYRLPAVGSALLGDCTAGDPAAPHVGFSYRSPSRRLIRLNSNFIIDPLCPFVICLWWSIYPHRSSIGETFSNWFHDGLQSSIG